MKTWLSGSGFRKEEHTEAGGGWIFPRNIDRGGSLTRQSGPLSGCGAGSADCYMWQRHSASLCTSGMSREADVVVSTPVTVEDSSGQSSAAAPGPLRGCFLCLLSFLLSVVMSTKKTAAPKKAPKTSTAAATPAIAVTTDRRRNKRPRSVSMSVELECPGHLKTKSHVSHTHSLEDHWKPSYLEGFLKPSSMTAVSSWFANATEEGISEASSATATIGIADSRQWPSFNDVLPSECKLKIFSFLSARERGAAARVCSEWSALMLKSSLWSSVDLTSFPLCYSKRCGHRCGRSCYLGYRDRVRKFMAHLQTVRPALHNLRFSFDIGDHEDGWLDNLEALLKCSRLRDLKTAHLNWKETPVKPLCSESVTWSTTDYNEMMHRHRHRQRRFAKFFEMFTAAAPNIKKLILPFDWSPRSLDSVCHLRQLDSLILEKYSVFQPFSQSSLDKLLADCSSLRRLVIEVYTPSGRGLQLYNVASNNLEYLDVSQCRGVYMQQVALPKVQVFKVSRHPWNGPLVCADSIHIPCIYEVLRDGAPSLKQINEHTLQPDWRDTVNPELETVLRAVCSCRQHKGGWMM